MTINLDIVALGITVLSLMASVIGSTAWAVHWISRTINGLRDAIEGIGERNVEAARATAMQNPGIQIADPRDPTRFFVVGAAKRAKDCKEP